MDQCQGHILMVGILREQLLLRRMRKWQMTDVMAQGGHSQRFSPLDQLIPVRKDASHTVVATVIAGNYVEYPAGQFHHAQRMLESPMRCPRIHQEGECKLMNVPQTLKRRGVNNPPFIIVETNEDVNGITYLMDMLCHISTSATDAQPNWVPSKPSETAVSVRRAIRYDGTGFGGYRWWISVST
jgi:hypothetical protein